MELLIFKCSHPDFFVIYSGLAVKHSECPVGIVTSTNRQIHIFHGFVQKPFFHPCCVFVAAVGSELALSFPNSTDRSALLCANELNPESNCAVKPQWLSRAASGKSTDSDTLL